MKYDFCSSVRFFSFFQNIFRTSVADPTNCFTIFFVRFGKNFNFFRHHKSRIKSKTKMSDNPSIFRRILIFFKEFLRTGKRHLVDVFLNFLARHPKTLIFNRKRFRLFINFHLDDRISIIHFRFTNNRQMFQFRRCIRRVGDQFTKKDLVIAVKKLFDQRENIFHRHINTSC